MKAYQVAETKRTKETEGTRHWGLVLDNVWGRVHVRREIHPQVTLVVVQLDILDGWVSRVVALQVTVGQRVLVVVQQRGFSGWPAGEGRRLLNEKVLALKQYAEMTTVDETSKLVA